MNERSIAEIIGWRNCQDRPSTPTWTPPEHWHRPDCRRHYGHPDHCRSCHGGPTVDDLLAWLRGREFTVKVQADRRVDFAVWMTLIHPDRKSKTHAKGDTLLAALEAAVRAVDAEGGAS